MKPAMYFGVYCIMIVLGVSVASYRGWVIFGNMSQAASSGSTGGTRAGGSSGFHK